MYRVRQIVLLLLAATAASSSLFANAVLLSGDADVTDLRWKNGTIRVAVSASLLRESSNIKSGSDVAGAVRRSLEAWSSVANIEFVQVSSDKLNVSPSGPAGDGTSLITVAQSAENVLLFARDPANAAATTRIFYGRRGEISEADIVLNPYQQFSTDGTFGTFDLESTLTHEIGHLLGLGHSTVLGATMNANYGRNGLFGLQNFTSRTLSIADIAAARAIYGNANSEATDCCGSVSGQVAVTGRTLKGALVWIEDMAGRVHGSSAVSGEGKFLIPGLGAGKYRLFAQETGDVKRGVTAQTVAEVIVAPGQTTEVTPRVKQTPREVEVSYLGFNGQLSQMAVGLSPGRSYTLYVGGRNLDPKRIAVSFNTPHITVVPETMRSLDYGPDVSVISFEVRIASRVARGEYTLLLTTSAGDRRALIGCLTIDSFNNPWSTFVISDS